MSIESAKLFIHRMKTDGEFAEKVTECKDSETRTAFIKSEGFDFTTEEIKEARGALVTKICKD
jgi:predicted ribosomally synthesized peptide with nif11-like leader